MPDLTRDDAGAFSPAALASALLTLALIPNSYSPASITVLLQEAAGRIDPGPSDPSPSDIAYDDMTRAWRNGDYPLARSLADALLGYLGGPDSGQPLTGDRDPYYVLQIYAYYAPLPDLPASDRSEDPRRLADWLTESERVVSAAGAGLDSGHLLELLEALSSAVRGRMPDLPPASDFCTRDHCQIR